MIFNSYSFVVFILCFFILFQIIPRRFKLVLLLAASYFFYGWWNFWFLSLILISTTVDFHLAKLIEKENNSRKRLSYLKVSLLVNLGILAFFKYFNFFIDSFESLFSCLGFTTSQVYLEVVLPVGISFYTFQTLAYTIDVYRKKVNAEYSFVKFAVYVAYFPQLVAGPIERASNLLSQLGGNLVPSEKQIKEGVWLLAWGFFLKVVVADNLAPVVNATFEAKSLSWGGTTIWLAVPAFCLQIYGDFAGYSKIARGVSKFIGIDLQRNFMNPFFAFSPSDFWRRWHITLSEWLRDYLYISLGGNRVGKLLNLRNLMITMLLGGLWHGASWVFVFWGLYHGLLLVICKSTIDSWLNKQTLLKIPFVFVMFFLSLYGWLIFRANDFEQLYYYSLSFFSFDFSGFERMRNQVSLFWLVILYVIVILVNFLAELKKSEYVLSFNKWIHLIPLFLILIVIYLFGAQQSDFIYFQF